MWIQDDMYEYEYKGVQCLKKIVQNNEEDRICVNDRVFKRILLPQQFVDVEYYTSSWGAEFIKCYAHVETEFRFENSKGRCGAQSNPFFSIASPTAKIDIAIATSINYRVIIRKHLENIEVIVEDVDENFNLCLLPQECYAYPEIYIHRYVGIKQCYEEKQIFMEAFYKEHKLHNDLLVLYNHWWAYEDFDVHEDVLLENAKIAKALGAEMLVLDAGWFGNDQSDEHWFTIRGDWDRENRKRFPHGVSELAKKIRKLGLKFGIWCEFEGLGVHANILKKNPNFEARRDGEALGYACFGNPEVQAWAIASMSRLIERYEADYWKLDFNLDPGLGCNEATHSHGVGHGLQAHEQGVYHVLRVLRQRYPHLVIENCSSGGQRINLEMAKYTDVLFMSDPDYSSHQLRLFIELSKWFLPRQILHFMWSNTCIENGTPPFANLDVNQCSKSELQYHMRISFLHQMGLSRRLPEHSITSLAIMKEEITRFKETLRIFIQAGHYYPLVLDEQLQVFQFSYEDEVLLFVCSQKAGTYELHLEQSSGVIMDLDTLQQETLHHSILRVNMQENLMCRLFLIKNL